MANDQIINYGLTTPNATATLQRAKSLLKQHLPVALPLYRRLQFGRFFDATTLLSNLNLNSTTQPPSDSPWFLAFVDRSCRPETEVWFFGSWEAESRTPDPATDRVHEILRQHNVDPENLNPTLLDNLKTTPPNDIARATEVYVKFLKAQQPSQINSTNTSSDQNKAIPPPQEDQETINTLLTNLIKTMKNLEIPTSIHQDLLSSQTNEQSDPGKDHGGFSRSDYGGHANDSNVMLWGAIHSSTVHMINQLGFITRKYKTGLVPNYNFIWHVDSMAAIRDLPSGLRWGELSKEDFALVRSRTQIPRQDRTLAVLPNLGIFTEAGQLVAWAFVGLDASLTTLHVEAEWRGKGLAKAITTKLFREKMDLFWEDGVEKLAHGYVIVGNKESEGMCRSLGGKSDWEVYWIRVDLSLVP